MYSEDLSSQQDYDGLRVINPFREASGGLRHRCSTRGAARIEDGASVSDGGWTAALRRRWDEEIVRYPDVAGGGAWIRGLARTGWGMPSVERLYTGARWAEGPVWFGDSRSLVFSDIPNNRMLRYCEVTDAVTLFRQPSNYSNGNTRDLQGRLITCEHLTRRVTRTEHDGTLTVLLDRFDGQATERAERRGGRFRSEPCGLRIPGYGIVMAYEGEKADAELPTRVYRLDPVTGEATVVAEDLVKPNGLCFSPDEARLYISDTGNSHNPDGPGHIRMFEVVEGRTLRGGEVFADMSPGFADGIRTDCDGNLWSSVGWAGPGTDGVHCLTPEGELIGRIVLPEPCANLCFGGAKRNRLFMTGSQSLYSLYVEAVGSQRP